MAITKEQVTHVSKLAALELSEQEVEKYQSNLAEILAHFEELSLVNTDNIAPLSHVHGSVNAFRDDVVKKSLPKDEALALAPDANEQGFRVPKII